MLDKVAEIQAPISCDSCRIGRYAVYAAIRDHCPSNITALRVAQRTLKEGRLIFREGELPGKVYTLFDGWAFRYKMLHEGRRQVLAYYIPGDLMVAQALSGAPLPFFVRAITPVTLCAFDTKAYFTMVMSTPEARIGLRDYMFACHNQTDDLLAALGHSSAMGCVVHLLASLVQRMENRSLTKDGTFRIPVSQKLLADTLGLTQVYANRIVGQLRRDGLIEINRNEIRILDVDALRAYARHE